MVKISGAAYNPEIDEGRLRTQMQQVLDVLSGDERWQWWTVTEIADVLSGHGCPNVPEPSVSAQIRNLRKRGNGGYLITGRYRKGIRIYEYRLEGLEQGEMF